MEEKIKNYILNKNCERLILEDKDKKVILDISDFNVFIDPEYQLYIDERKANIITCKDCGAEFEFTENEQKFYEEKGFSIPRRCKTCRNERKQNDGQNS